MARPRSPEKLALRICAAVKEATAARSMQWVSLNDIAESLGEDEEAMQAGVEFSRARFWLSTGGHPAHSLSVTADGMRALVKAKKR